MGAPVYLNVYDLANNDLTYWCGLGVFHAAKQHLHLTETAGVEVHGTEYAYGGHDYDYTGVFATNPRDAPGNVLYRESVYMGDTDLNPEEVHQMILKLGQEYKGNKYHLLQRNCNHFASDVVYQLTGQPAPGWINRLAGLAVMLHCLLPRTWVPPLQNPESSRRSLLPEYGRERSDAYATGPMHASVLVTPPTAGQGASLMANRA